MYSIRQRDITNCIASLQDELVKNSKETTAMYRCMYKDRYTHKYSYSLT